MALEKKASTKADGKAKAEGKGKKEPVKKTAAKKESAPKKATAKKAPAKKDAPKKAAKAKKEPTKKAGKAPAAKAKPKAPAAPPVVKASARYVRIAPRKARLVMDHIRGKRVEHAQAILRHAPRAISTDILKLLNSAVANAEQNHGLIGDELVVSAAFVGAGPTLKRWRARARGRVARIRKRTCHITVRLAQPDGAVIPVVEATPTAPSDSRRRPAGTRRPPGSTGSAARSTEGRRYPRGASGGMAERTNATVLKTVEAQASVGSNPTPSAGDGGLTVRDVGHRSGRARAT